MSEQNTISLARVREFVARENIPTPALVLDLEVVKQNYLEMKRLFPNGEIFYAVKANPHNEVIKLLIELGSSFDVASPFELNQCLELGATPSRISFGNTIKKEADIAYAYEKGVRLFVFDAEEELKKISRAAPGSDVFCRILTSGHGADWPLSLKFGCHLEMAAGLLVDAKEKYGLNPVGVSFHVGSQQNDVSQWEESLAKVYYLFETVADAGIKLSLINLGGGLPARYLAEPKPLERYAEAIQRQLEMDYGDDCPRLILEPGRSLVANAGMIVSEVILVSKKTKEDEKRWVYLDVGKFGGLIETLDESIRYPLYSDWPESPQGPVIIAGPTCDSMDILYKDTDYELPLVLEPGDKIYIDGTGAYTSSYSSVCFNGFPPLRTYILK